MRTDDPRQMSRAIMGANLRHALEHLAEADRALECVQWNVSEWPSGARVPLLRRLRRLRDGVLAAYDETGRVAPGAEEEEEG